MLHRFKRKRETGRTYTYWDRYEQENITVPLTFNQIIKFSVVKVPEHVRYYGKVYYVKYVYPDEIHAYASAGIMKESGYKSVVKRYIHLNPEELRKYGFEFKEFPDALEIFVVYKGDRIV